MNKEPTRQKTRHNPELTVDLSAETVPVQQDEAARATPSRAETAPVTLPRQIGRYQVIRPLGRGGFGFVLLAHDPQLDRRVAIKIARTPPGADKQWQTKMLAEARTVARLKHPNIVAVHDAGEYEGGVFVAMEYVEGGTLRERTASGPLPVEEAVRIMIQVADAVHYAHKRGIVHCDLKPGNILLEPDGTPKVADFGLALWDEARWSRRGETCGTPAYMAPEQVRGELHHADGRSDIWALGVILYELLAGRRPFSGETNEALYDEILSREPKPLRQIDETIPLELDALCSQCLTKDVRERIPTAYDVRTALERVARGSSRSYRRRLWASRSLMLLAAAAVVGGGVATFKWSTLGSRVAAVSGPTRPAESSRIDLLATPPVPVVFDFSDPSRQNYSYSPAQRLLAVQAPRWAVFKLGEMPTGPFNLRATVLLVPQEGVPPDLSPHVIVLWGLTPQVDAQGRTQHVAVGVLAEALRETQQLSVALCRVVLALHPQGGLYVRNLYAGIRRKVPWDQERPLTFDLALGWGRLESAQIQGRPVSLVPPRTKDLRWEQHAIGNIGVMLLRGRFTLTDTTIRLRGGADR